MAETPQPDAQGVPPFAEDPFEFSAYFGGGMEYGAKDLSVDRDGRLWLSFGESRAPYVGVGTFVKQADDSELAKAREIVQLLCRPDSQTGRYPHLDPVTDVPHIFSVACLEHGKLVRREGSFHLCPEDIFRRTGLLRSELTKSAYEQGRRVVKLDLVIVDVIPQPVNFLVIVRFVNSGERTIRFKTPDRWQGTFPTEKLNVGGKHPESTGPLDTLHQGGWSFDLARLPMLNASDYPKGEILLLPGEQRELRYLAAPNKKYKASTLDFAVGAGMNIDVEGKEWTVGSRVNFYSGDQNRKRITIDRDYPSAPQEWEEYEARHRQALAGALVPADSKFKEDGYYRPIDRDSNKRGRFVTRFTEGAVAPDATDQQDDQGHVMGPGNYAWVWEADSQSVGESVSKAPCPKSGHWIALIPTDVPNASYFLNRDTTVACRVGEKLPSVGLGRSEDEARVTWVWMRALDVADTARRPGGQAR